MGALSWLHPWLLPGLLAASLPVLIHLIGRRRAPVVAFAAFDFLMAVNKRLAKRERLRQILLLALRTLAVVALVVAIARPMPRQLGVAAEGSRHVALVVDASASMAYTQDGETLMARAKARAREVISYLQPGDVASLVIAGETTRAALETPTGDRATLRAALDALGEPAGTADLGAAIQLALSKLGEHAAGSQLVVISDLAESSFLALQPTSLEPPPEVRLVDVAGRARPTALPNLAVEKIAVERSSGSAHERSVRLVVRNYGEAAVANVPVELRVEEAVAVRGYVDVAGRSASDKVLTYDFGAPGVYHVTAQLADADAYPSDDAAYATVISSKGIRVLAVDGDPRTTPYEDELFFLERALEAVPRGEAPIEARLCSAAELALGDVDLAGFDVVILANVGELPSAVVNRLREFVNDGGGLWLTLGDKVRFERFNEVFFALLPHPLRDLFRAADRDAGTPPRGLGELDWEHPVLAGLAAAEEALRGARTSAYFNLDSGAGTKARTLIRLDNGAPLLVEQRREQGGRVLLLATSIDVDLTSLPLRAAFPALVQRIVRYLADALDAGGAPAVRAGVPVSLTVPTAVKALALTSPSGERREVPVAEEGQKLELGALAEVGVWRAELFTKEWRASPGFDVAVSSALAESDFLPVRPERIAEALGGTAPAAVSLATASGAVDDPLASRGFAAFLLLGLALFFVSESLLAARG